MFKNLLLKNLIILSLVYSSGNATESVEKDPLPPLPSMSASEQLEIVFSGDVLASKCIPLSFHSTFIHTSEQVLQKIKEYFPDQNRRIENFEQVYDYGKALFNNSSVSSKNYLLTHLAYSFMMSDDLIYDMPEFSHWKHPSTSSKWLLTSEGSNYADGGFISPDYFLPVASNKGFFSLEFVNQCFAYNIECVGIPFNRVNEYDLIKGASSFGFAIHDVFHGGNMFQKKHEKQRKIIYEDIKQKGDQSLHVPYFLVFHEDAYSCTQIQGGVDPDPIKNTILFYDSLFPFSENNFQSFVIQKILMQAKKTPFSYFIDGASTHHALLMPDLKEEDIDIESFKAQNPEENTLEDSGNIRFKIKSQPQSEFLVHMYSSYNLTIDTAIANINLLNNYGANIDMSMDREAFDLKAYKTVMMRHLESFHEMYRYLFEKENIS